MGIAWSLSRPGYRVDLIRSLFTRELTMFSQQTTPCTDRAGFVDNVSDINLYQGCGAVALLGTVAGSTLAMGWIAPIPTLTGLGGGAGLLYAGHKVKTNKASTNETPTTPE